MAIFNIMKLTEQKTGCTFSLIVFTTMTGTISLTRKNANNVIGMWLDIGH